jgi:hypothetical protein
MSNVSLGPLSAAPWFTTVNVRRGGCAVVPFVAENAVSTRSGRGTSMMTLSKFVSQPFELPIVTLEHTPLQFVAIVERWPGESDAVRVGCPAQLSVTVLGAAPPFAASSRTRRRGVTKFTLALVTWLTKLMLLVVKLAYGPECHQLDEPQSITPAGYCPVSG